MLSIALLSTLAQTQPTANRPVVYKDVTELEIERGLSLEGELVGPGGVIVSEPPPLKFHPLIKLREDFDEEMDTSLEEIR